MGKGTTEECRSLLLWCREQGYRQLAVTGISMGGCMAALIGAFFFPPSFFLHQLPANFLLLLLPGRTCGFPVAVAANIPSHSASPIFTEVGVCLFFCCCLVL